MSPKQVVADAFEQIKTQAQHATSVLKQEPGKMLNNLMGENDEGVEDPSSGQVQIDPQQLQQQQQIARMRQLDEARKQQALRGLRQQTAILTKWENERKERDMGEQQKLMKENQGESEEKKEKQQIKQLERREKSEALSVSRAKTHVEAKMGKF